MASPVVRKAQRSDLATVAAVLAMAFDNDPTMRHIVPNDHYRRRLTALFTFEAATTPHGTWVAVDEGEVAGAALWAIPGQRSALVPFVRHIPDLVRAFGQSLPSGLRSFRTIGRVRPKSPPHWYLQTIGVAKAGRGIGGQLLRDGLDRVDAARMPAYLESSAPGNVPIYERYGFRATGEIQLPGGPALITMWRDPQ
ncbi:GNAT family N-acetyltransferase [Phytoactinopolyspora mesophila]|uniref:GNAT family N-acetyltransferase n=1 Tax=Phytoactinopolyspora mesophila TaxID=2650750 RepID=A0A7K3M7T0_9ACTN|nr:GNAT family N-acetyltransferase [Phytoactinopolyspora mesophila]NDL59002.1 GNAT family N-acetyltransferase [Phytoactinopolyspora mesophila]